METSVAGRENDSEKKRRWNKVMPQTALRRRNAKDIPEENR